MAINKVVVNVVDVGQGQCTFVEVYDSSSSTKLKHALLFDCGSNKHSDEMYINLDWIAARVLTMTTPAFDCIFFSHSDTDHTSHVRYILDKIAETKKPRVKEVWYGGAHVKYTKDGENILDYLIDKKFCTNANLKAMPSNDTGYNPDEDRFYEYLWKSTDSAVYVYGIAANVLSSNPDWSDNDREITGNSGEALNKVSMVCGLYFGGASYVICGDATNKTMAAINTLFTGGTGLFDKNIMTTLPHHGSRRTGLAIPSSGKASLNSRQTVKTFAATLQSKTISVSAYELHSHPSLELMEYFIPTITSPLLMDPRLNMPNTHILTAYIDIDLTTPKRFKIEKNEEYSFETKTNTFSTRYSQSGSAAFFHNLESLIANKANGVKAGESLDGFASWKYETDTNGDFVISGHANLATTKFTQPVTTTSVSQKIDSATTTMGLGLESQSLTAIEIKPEVKLNPVRKPASTSKQFHTKIKHFN